MEKLGGGKKDLVFLHGGAGRYSIYFPFLKKLAEDYTVYYFNLPGHGEAPAKNDLNSVVSYIIEKIEAEQLDKIVLIGHSYGGLCGLETAYRLENVTDLVLIDPLIPPIDKSKSRLIFDFLVGKTIRAIYYQPTSHLLKFYPHATVSLLDSLLTQGSDSKKTYDLLLDCCFSDTKYNEKALSGTNVQVIFGEKDSVVDYQKLPPELLKRCELVHGEHDWCVADPQLAKEKIDKYVL